MATEKSSAPAHPSTVEVESSSRPGLRHVVTLEPEESCSCEAAILVCRHIRIARIRAAKSRPCACIGGFVFVGSIDYNDVERTASYRCRRCADSRRPGAAAITGTPAPEA
jgi:hypothetical protein